MRHHWQASQLDRGDRIFDTLLSDLRQHNQLFLYLEFTRTAGNYWRDADEPQTAIKWYHQGLPTQLWRHPIDSLEQDALGWLYVNLGYTYRLKLGQFYQARKYYQLALQTFDQLGVTDPGTARYVWIPLANLYTRLGEFQAGEQLLHRYISLSRHNGDTTGLVRGTMDLGMLYDSWGRVELAEKSYQQALEHSPAVSNSRLQILVNLTALLLNQHRLAEARTYHQKAQQLISRASKTDFKRSILHGYLRNQAIIAQKNKDYATAEAVFQTLYNQLYDFYGSTQRREFGKHYVAVGQLYLAQGRYRDATMAFQEALVSVVYKYCPDSLFKLPKMAQCYAENTILDALEGLAQTWEAWFQQTREIHLLDRALSAREQMHMVSEELRKVHLYEGSQLRNLEEIRLRSEAGIALALQLAQLTHDP
ncbi:MAG: hypothetical protein D6772_16010, partial [Bacteroidetes bacterium]